MSSVMEKVPKGFGDDPVRETISSETCFKCGHFIDKENKSKWPKYEMPSMVFKSGAVLFCPCKMMNGFNVCFYSDWTSIKLESSQNKICVSISGKIPWICIGGRKFGYSVEWNAEEGWTVKHYPISYGKAVSVDPNEFCKIFSEGFKRTLREILETACEVNRDFSFRTKMSDAECEGYCNTAFESFMSLCEMGYFGKKYDMNNS